MPTNQHPTGTDRGGRVRLLPVPESRPAPLLPGQPSALGSPGGVAGPGQLVLALTTGVGTPRWTQASDIDPVVAARPTSDTDLPDPTPVCATLASAVVEVLAGRRPVAQLTRWTTMDVQEGLTRRLALANRLRPARSQRAAVVRRVRITHPADGVVEAAAVVHDTHRVRAIALRLEGWDTRWRLTALEIG
ncbi:Rv3235 family protein [uncultured Pseudokineococcus sp.]|uniref:Rv3235 family protein n=1 Tax=uncultured Pseudokineococcus sp. TaxID=1642928 RepID=UPI0026062377|nr:Rv3235 family protein [uncultured Pseudokineococcus sp.]